MATYAAEQPATLGRRPTVTVGVPIVASKITAPGPLRLLPSVKALRGAAAASRSEHP